MDLHDAQATPEEGEAQGRMPEDSQPQGQGGLDREAEGVPGSNEPQETTDYGLEPVEWSEHNEEFGLESVPAAPALPGPWRVLRSVAMVCLIVASLSAVAAALKLYTDRSAAQAALVAAVGSLPGKVALFGADSMSGQLAAIQDDVNAGNFTAVQDKIAALKPLDAGTGNAPSFMPSTKPGDNTSTAPDFPPAAQQFFETHPDLAARFVRYNEMAKKLRDAGKDVQPLRDIRDQIVTAATAGNADQVASLLDDFAAKMGVPPGQAGGGPAPVPDALKAKLQKVGAAFEKARGEGKDLRKAAALMQRVQAAGQAGDFTQTNELLDRALAAINSAPRMPRGGPPRRMMPKGVRPGGPMGQPNGLVQVLFGLLQVEEQNLATIYKAVDTAKTAVLGANADQVKGYLATAMTALDQIGARRRDLTRRLRGETTPGASGQKPGTKPPPDEAANAADQSRKRGLLVRERVITLLRAIRKLPEAEFEKHTIELANEMIGAMLPQRPSPDDMAAAAQSGANQGGKGPQDTQAAQRVKTKMMIIYEPYQEMRGRKQDTTIVDGYLARTRKMISLGNYVEAEKAVDQALKLMDITPTAAQLQKGATNNVASPAKQQPKPKQ